MEQKRTLWIITAAGFFLMVVLLAALMLYKKPSYSNNGRLPSNSITWTAPEKTNSSPDFSNAANSNTASSTIPESEDNQYADINFVTESEIVPNENGNPVTDKNEISQINTDNITIYSNGNTTVYGVTPSTPEGKGDFNSSTTIDIYQEETPAASTGNVKAQNHKAEVAMKETQAIRHPETSVVENSSTKSSAKASAKTAAKNTAKTESTQKSSAKNNTSAGTSKTSAKTVQNEPDRFWIQVGSFTSKKAADEARNVLDEKGFQCEVFTTNDAKGTLYYRVRIGPFTTKAEAEYWKNQVTKVSGFEKSGSYITNSTVRK